MKLMYIQGNQLICSQRSGNMVALCLVKRLIGELKQSNPLNAVFLYCRSISEGYVFPDLFSFYLALVKLITVHRQRYSVDFVFIFWSLGNIGF